MVDTAQAPLQRRVPDLAMRNRGTRRVPSRRKRIAKFSRGLGLSVLAVIGGPACAQLVEPPETGAAGTETAVGPARVPGGAATGRLFEPAPSPIGFRPLAVGIPRKWTVTPSVGVEVTFTDNATLSPPAEAESDVFFDVYPGIVITGGTPRLDLDIAYTGQASYSAKGTLSSEYFNNLEAYTRITGIENFFYVEASAVVSTQYISALAPRPLNPEAEPANRAEGRSAQVSPYIQGFLPGAEIAYTVRYSYATTVLKEQVDDGTPLPTSNTNQWIGHLAGPLGRTFAWGLDYFSSAVSWDNQPVDQEYQRDLGTVYYQIDPFVTVSASAGREWNNFDLVGQWYTDYGGGVRWRPFARTQVAGTVMKRFFGTGYDFVFNHRTHGTAWSLVANKNIATYSDVAFAAPGGSTRALLDAALTAQIGDPIERRAAVNRLIAQAGVSPLQANQSSFFTEAVMLEKQAVGSFALIGARNTLTFSAYAREWRPIGQLSVVDPDDEFAAADRQTEVGAGIAFNHRLTPRTSLSAVLSSSIVRSFTGAVQLEKATQNTALLTLSTQLGPKTTGFIGLRYQRFDTKPSDDPPATEHAILVGASYVF